MPSERDQEFLSPVLYTAAPKCVCIRRLAGARHLSPVVLGTLCPVGGSEPLTGAPRSGFTAQLLVLSFDVCPGLGISPLRANILADFFSGRSSPKIGPGFFSSGIVKSLKLFFQRFAVMASGTEIFWRVSLKFQLFMETSRFHCHRSKLPL